MSGSYFEFCEALIRKADYDRYLAALFAPSQLRPYLFALYAFNYEVAKTAETVSQPMLGHVRLQWWRDSIEALYGGKQRDHEVVQALGETLRACDVPRALFDGLIESRENDLEDVPFGGMANLEAYADVSSGHVMRLAARILGAGDALDSAARDAGIAYALVGLLRALPYHAAKRRLLVPVDVLNAVGLSPESVFAGEASAALTAVIAQITNAARAHLCAARPMEVSRSFLPALLPATLTPLYGNALTRSGFNPFREIVDIPVYRRQLAMLRAMITGRV
jgi:phytoene/squalene synthetase